jgi:hypothetical protein
MPLPINGHLEVFCLWPPFVLSPLLPHTHCLDIQFPQQEKKIPPGLTKYKICFGCWTAIAELLDNAIDEVKEQSFLSSFFVPLWHLLAEFGSTRENYGMHIKKIL